MEVRPSSLVSSSSLPTSQLSSGGEEPSQQLLDIANTLLAFSQSAFSLSSLQSNGSSQSSREAAIIFSEEQGYAKTSRNYYKITNPKILGTLEWFYENGENTRHNIVFWNGNYFAVDNNNENKPKQQLFLAYECIPYEDGKHILNIKFNPIV